ncbi:hypothetical protein OAA86_02135 [Rhodospirillales bacterium]|nr:hypothetical protein [Rhodospirillales bacterium]
MFRELINIVDGIGTLYNLKKQKESEEFHLFKAKYNNKDKCEADPKPICTKMRKGDAAGKDKFSCKNEDEARMECAREGRAVCGNCVIRLYTTYPD